VIYIGLVHDKFYLMLLNVLAPRSRHNILPTLIPHDLHRFG
jgi:hypothetical protein